MRKWLADRLKELDKSKIGLAAALKVAPARVTEMLNGTRNIQSHEVEPIANYLQWPQETVLAKITGKRGANVVRSGLPIVKVPVISWVQAGRYTEVTDPYPVGAHDREIDVAYSRTTLIALDVVGNSMNRVAPAGSQIFVDYSMKELVPGRYYVLKCDEGATFKRYRSGPDRFEPDSTEPDHDTIYPDGSAEVVGQVVKVIRDL